MLLILAPLSIILIVFAPSFLHIWLGHEFAVQSVRTLQWLAFAYLIQSLTSIPYSFLQGQGHADLTLAFQVIELVVTLPIFWFTLRIVGIAGAAAIVTVRVTLDLALLLSASRKRGGIDAAALKKAGLLPLGGAILFLLACTGACRFALRGFGAVLGVGAGFAVYVLLIWRGVLDGEERAKLRRFTLRRGKPA
jgi:O-antigen/teichoic acid export membrane protein